MVLYFTKKANGYAPVLRIGLWVQIDPELCGGRSRPMFGLA
jgi:hypothetical protein